MGARVYGFIRIHSAGPYQMDEVKPKEMDALLANGDGASHLFRFDRNRRVFPTPPEGAELVFYDKEVG